MQTIETTAKTTEEAIELALKELDVERAEVDIDVISKGKESFLGLRNEPARVRVTVLEQASDLVKISTEVIETLLSKMNASAVVNLLQAMKEDTGGPAFNIEGDDSGLLIGRRGETLKALQFIVRFMVGRQLGTRAQLSLDVEGYQERRYQSLANLAQRVAQRVSNSGRPVTLEPMPSNERRIIHVTLANHRFVSTESSGSGDGRQVTINTLE